jgi:hypothetical protein
MDTQMDLLLMCLDAIRMETCWLFIIANRKSNAPL